MSDVHQLLRQLAYHRIPDEHKSLNLPVIDDEKKHIELIKESIKDVNLEHIREYYTGGTRSSSPDYEEEVITYAITECTEYLGGELDDKQLIDSARKSQETYIRF